MLPVHTACATAPKSHAMRARAFSAAARACLMPPHHQLVAYQLLITPAAGLGGSVLLACATSLWLGRVSSIVHPRGSMMRGSAADLSPVPASTGGCLVVCCAPSVFLLGCHPHQLLLWPGQPHSIDVWMAGPNLPPTSMADIHGPGYLALHWTLRAS